MLFAPGTAAFAASAFCCCFAGSLASPFDVLERRKGRTGLGKLCLMSWFSLLYSKLVVSLNRNIFK